MIFLSIIIIAILNNHNTLAVVLIILVGDHSTARIEEDERSMFPGWWLRSTQRQQQRGVACEGGVRGGA